MAKHKDELINAVKKYSVTKKVVLTVIAFLSIYIQDFTHG